MGKRHGQAFIEEESNTANKQRDTQPHKCSEKFIPLTGKLKSDQTQCWRGCRPTRLSLLTGAEIVTTTLENLHILYNTAIPLRVT